MTAQKQFPSESWIKKMYAAWKRRQKCNGFSQQQWELDDKILDVVDDAMHAYEDSLEKKRGEE